MCITEHKTRFNMILANLNQIAYKQKVLAQAVLVLCALNMPVYAMQVLDDDSLSGVTGGSIAFTNTDFHMRFNGEDDTAGTGYFRFIPLGALSAQVQTYNIANPTEKIGKGDIYLYGLSISGNDNDVTTQLSPSTVDLGTSANPWLISVQTLTTPDRKSVV